MLRPQDNGIREARRLDGLWDLAPDAAGVGRARRWWEGRLPGARTAPVPSSYNDLFLEDDLHDLVGDVWYQRRVVVPRSWAGRRVVLRFDSATHRATVFAGDHEVASHEGGYLPFEGDVTAQVRAGEELRVTAVVNNELSWQSIPPGIVVDTPSGRQQRTQHDFFNYAGLHRSVWLAATDATHLADLGVVTEIDGTTGVVRYRGELAGPGDPEVRVRLRDAAGAVVAEGRGISGELRVSRAELWRIGRGTLYELELDLVDGEDVIDRYRLPVGIRTVRVDGTRFLLNGEPVYFRGFGMHEDHVVRGKGHDPVSMVHDFELLRWLGANSFRTSHYPYAEEVLDHADRLGILVIDETAAVGLNLGAAASLLGGKPLATFSDDTINDATREVHRQSILELIDRDKNHPSVVLWCLANEPESTSDAAAAYFTPLFEAARSADPTRPVGFANVMLAPAGRCKVSRLADVVMLNRYYGWYVHPGDLAAAEAALEAELRAWAKAEGKPILVTEYGADALPGLHTLRPTPWSEDYQAELLDTYHRVFDRVDAVVGEHVWNFADFMTTSSFFRVEGNRKGVFTRDRHPKAAAHLLRRRWRG